MHAPEAEKPILFRFLVCLFYGITSGSLSLIMKSLLSGYRFEGFFLILTAQFGLQLALCVLSRDFMGNPLSIPPYSRALHIKSLRMGLLAVGNVGAGLVALRMVNVPMFLCIRRLVAPTILLYELVFLGKVASAGVNVAVAAIFVGTLLAGWETLSADFVGYAVTFINNLLSAAVRAAALQAAGGASLSFSFPLPRSFTRTRTQLTHPQPDPHTPVRRCFEAVFSGAQARGDGDAVL